MASSTCTTCELAAMDLNKTKQPLLQVRTTRLTTFNNANYRSYFQSDSDANCIKPWAELHDPDNKIKNSQMGRRLQDRGRDPHCQTQCMAYQT